MQNGKLIALKGLLLVTLAAQRVDGFGQKKDTPNSEYLSFKVETECKSKSIRTLKPTEIRLSKTRLAGIKTVKDLVRDIPANCEVFCAFFSLKKADDKVFEFINVGNDMVYADKLSLGKYIIIEDLVTSCPMLHKANYKIIFR